MPENHIGKLIRQRVEELKMPKQQFAKMLNVSRSTAYYIFNQKSIDIERLHKIEKILNADFQIKPPQNQSRYLIMLEVSEQEFNNFKSDRRLKLHYKVC